MRINNIGDKMDANNILYIEANPEKGFNYGYLLYIPEENINPVLIAEMNNTTAWTDDEKEVYDDAYHKISTSCTAFMIKSLNMPYLITLFIKPKGVPTHTLSRESLETRIESIKRIDKQFIAIVEDAKKQLEKFNIKVNHKFILNGFSSSGSFSNRFATMYPELLKGVISGGQTYAIIPEKEQDGIKLTYPIGIYDLKELTGIDFNKEVYLKLPQFIYEGSEDDENDTTKWRDCMTPEQANIIYTLFGNQPKSKRLEKQIKSFKTKGYQNIDFRLYQGEDHKPQVEDMETFIKKLTKVK